jgi:hypothetical protein
VAALGQALWRVLIVHPLLPVLLQSSCQSSCKCCPTVLMVGGRNSHSSSHGQLLQPNLAWVMLQVTWLGWVLTPAPSSRSMAACNQ